MTISLTPRIVDQGFSTTIAKTLSYDKDVSPAFTDIKVAFRSLVTKEFNEAVDPYGVKWAPLSKRRLKEKKQRGQPLIPLTATQQMKRGFDGVVGPKRLIFGSDRSFPDGRDASSHQKGFTGSGGRRTPPRKMLPMDSDTLPVTWQKMVDSAFAKMVKDL